MWSVAERGFECKIELLDGFLSISVANVRAPETLQPWSNYLPVSYPLSQLICGRQIHNGLV